jgi:mannose-1-phosphate guanylyltransferase
MFQESLGSMDMTVNVVYPDTCGRDGMNYTVFLLSAGFGTRLRPLTLHRPKPLLPLLGFPMVKYAVEWLRAHGHDRIIVNAHHLWEHVAAWSEKEGLGLQVELPDILGTGGGVRAAKDQLAEKFLIWNGDIVSNIDPNRLLEECPVEGAAMALRYCADLQKTTRLIIDDEGIVQRIGDVCIAPNAPAVPDTLDGLHFTGIHAMSRASLEHIGEGFQCVVRSAYKELVAQEKVRSIRHEDVWFDTGVPTEYFDVNMKALKGELPLSFDPWEHANDSFLDSFVHYKAQVNGAIKECIVGADAEISRDAHLSRCIVWDSVQVPAGVYENGVFFDGGFLSLGGEE